MIRGIKTAAEGMKSLLTMNDTIANNLANINTPGFKQTLISFKDKSEVSVNKVSTDINSSDYKQKIGKLSTGSSIDQTSFDFSQGGLRKTGRTFDMAIKGDGFFAIETPDGVAYTRNGSFTVNPDGTLVTQQGYPVLGDTGTIDINMNKVRKISINYDGTIESEKQKLGKVSVFEFENKDALKAAGNSLFVNTDEDNEILEVETPEIHQGYIEGSNSNAIRCMVESIQGIRTYETLSKVVKSHSSTIEKTVNQVGKIKV